MNFRNAVVDPYPMWCPRALLFIPLLIYDTYTLKLQMSIRPIYPMLPLEGSQNEMMEIMKDSEVSKEKMTHKNLIPILKSLCET